MGCKVLTKEQTQHFIDKGHIVISQAFPKDLAAEWREFAFKRLGYNPDDSSTWQEERIHMPSINSVPIQSVSPYTYDVICDLLVQFQHRQPPQRKNTPHQTGME